MLVDKLGEYAMYSYRMRILDEDVYIKDKDSLLVKKYKNFILGKNR